MAQGIKQNRYCKPKSRQEYRIQPPHNRNTPMNATAEQRLDPLPSSGRISGDKSGEAAGASGEKQNSSKPRGSIDTGYGKCRPANPRDAESNQKEKDH